MSIIRTAKLLLHAKSPDLPGPQGEESELFVGCRDGILEIDYIYIWKAEPKK